MYYVDNNSGSPTMPALSPAQSNIPTWFTEGDKNKGISWIGQDWLNILQAELLNILSEAGIKPDKGKLNQLTLSIKAIITANAYTQANNLKEIFDAGVAAQAAARGHLGLGKLATKDSLGAGDVDAVSKANGGTFENNIAVTGTLTSKQVVVSVNQYPGFTTSVSAQSGSQAPFYLGPVTLGAGDIFIPYIKESTTTPDGKKAVISFGFNKNGKKPHASPAVHVATEDGKYQLWEFDTETGRLINNTTGGVALLSELAPVKKAIDDTQTGLAAQGVMWITSADDLSNLPSGARRFASNKAPATVLPAAGYFFIEVLAKRDTANGSCILATSDAGDVWMGLRYTVPNDAAFTWIQLNQNVQNLGLKETLNPTKRVSIGNIGTGAFDGSTPSINIGDSDSGFIGSADGVLDVYCNNAKVGYIDNAGLHMLAGIATNHDLVLQSDERRHIIIQNADGSVRAYIYKDKDDTGIHINNGVDGSGDFVLGKDSILYVPYAVRAGGSKKLAIQSDNNSALNATFNLWGDANRPTVIELDDDQGWHLFSQRNTDGSILFEVNGRIMAHTALHSGDATLATDGNVYGTIWGGWLNDWINNNLSRKNTASLATNGWFKDASTGLIIQWGIAAGNLNKSVVNLPIPFPNAGLWSLGWVAGTLDMGNDDWSNSASLLNNSQLTVTTDHWWSTAWIAIGH